MKKEYIIPIFVPNLGCPNDCVFCNQERISGKQTNVTTKNVASVNEQHERISGKQTNVTTKNVASVNEQQEKISGKQTNVTASDVEKTIQYYLDNFKDDNKYVEIAFFGGSFTGIDVDVQKELLEVANKYIEKGKVGSIRISTRPDYINKDILKMLKKYHVKTIELGVQSSNDYILNRSKRNHTFNDVIRASKLIRRYHFTLGHQMMIGMPESTEIDEINTAKDLIRLKPKMVRIYPVLVIKGTELEHEYREGEYKPLVLQQAIERTKTVTYMFRKKHIDVIRIGLQNTEAITDPEQASSEVVAGPYHPAFRQLVESSMWYDSIAEKIKKINVKVKTVEIRVNEEDINNVVGHKRENIHKLKELYDLDVIVKQDENLKPGKFEIRVIEKF